MRGIFIKSDLMGLGNSNADIQATNVVIEGITICNCATASGKHGGAVFRGTLIDCRVFDNKATTQASVGRESSFYRCIIDHNKGGEQAIQWFSHINCCTLGPDNTDMSGTPQPVLAYRNGSSATVVNSIVLGSAVARNNEPYPIRNCAFMTGRVPAAASLPLTDCVVTNIEMLALDADYRPVIGSNAAIDRGDATQIAASIDDGMDLSGNQRVMNGAMDIGALEADWRPVYAAYIGGKRLSVTNASSVVYANGAHEVCLPSGSVDGTVDVAQTSCRWFDVSFRVTGNGTFSISINGTPFASYTYAAGAQLAHIPVPAGEMGIRFEYVPGENDTGDARIASARLVRGFVLSFR